MLYMERVAVYMEDRVRYTNAYLKKRGRVTVYTQLYLTCKNSYMFRLYIFSHHQATYRTLK
jgi:hypothetical protein